VGYLADKDDLTEAMPDPRPLGNVHETAAGWELVKRLGLALPLVPGRPAVAVAARPDLAPQPGAPVLAVHVGASPGKARLPESLLHAVAAAWLQKPGARVVWLGDTNESTIASRTRNGLDPDRSIMACGKLTLPELAGVAGAATVFLGRDSGPAHLAAAAGGNVVVVIPAARADMSVIRWRPPGDQVTIITCEGRARWWEKTERASTRLFAALSPARVIAAVEAAAERASRPDTVSTNRKHFA
jgi:ADP-heptose:LPS heptosyltransferase